MMNRSITPPEYVQVNPGNAPARNTHSWMSYIPIAIVALIGVMVTWHAFNVVTGWERQQVQQAFRAAAIDRVLMVQREIEQTLAWSRTLAASSMHQSGSGDVIFASLWGLH